MDPGRLIFDVMVFVYGYFLGIAFLDWRDERRERMRKR